MATAMATPKTQGGAFLLESRTPEEIYTPEDFTDEHHAIARTADEFWQKEIAPNVERIQHQEPGVAVSVLKKSAELGLTAVIIPERYGGMELDLTSMMIVAERLSRDGSYSAWHGAHTGIGTLPLLFYGTEEQKQRYLPKLARAEMVAAYCLSEPQAGSDALAAKTRADLSEDGKHYVLNGQKMWITNGGHADLYTVFAKVGGEKFTAFLVERAWPGVKPGNEEKKMGIKGSSTTPVYFDNVRVPVENVLGEVGKGHHIAFNILNMGRFKLGPFAVGGAKYVLQACLKYAKERKAFGKSIAEFGMIQHKLAEMAIRIYAVETMSYRVVGMIDAALGDFSWDLPDASQRMLKAVEEFAMECSYMKVYGSEMLDYVTDEGVQIHGGYGYHQDYLVERAYRDSRINRIFEGTNEINRMLATGMLLKRAQRGQLPLVEAVKRLQSEILAGPTLGAVVDEDALVTQAKKVMLFCLGVAYQKFLQELEQQQEILAALTDIGMNAFAIESVHLRTKRLAKAGKGELVSDMASVFLRDAMEEIERSARYLLAACSSGDSLRMNLAVLKRFTKFEPVNSIAARRRIAERLLASERYVVY
ncbi:MAG: acyl-CoA dehydrogenase family protein [Bryobacteraceae bacterium]|nr:acyl-CoA dehydrogenase family protein [Bryobacteraceae bacterium]MDW8379565.1 acyl-CoA dehydrogenase family protein [Bryobacterales bacterium]